MCLINGSCFMSGSRISQNCQFEAFQGLFLEGVPLLNSFAYHTPVFSVSVLNFKGIFNKINALDLLGFDIKKTYPNPILLFSSVHLIPDIHCKSDKISSMSSEISLLQNNSKFFHQHRATGQHSLPGLHVWVIFLIVIFHIVSFVRIRHGKTV